MTTIQQKLTRQMNQFGSAAMCFFDIDGTIFTLDHRFLKAPFFNFQTYQLLQENHIPFVLVTGRFYWHWGRDLEVMLEGFPKPDAIIYGGGTKVRWKDTSGHYQEEHFLSDEKSITPPPPVLGKQLKKISPYMYATTFFNTPYTKLVPEMNKLEKEYGKDGHVFYSESVIKPNDADVFSGGVFIGSPRANKESAVMHMIKKAYANLEQKTLKVYLFGDGSIDIPMLSMKSPDKNITLHQYLVHPTVMARITGKKLHVQISEDEGPQTILNVLRKSLGKSYYSPAQNSPLRTIERYVESLLDIIVDPKLSANEVSLLGLKKMRKGAQLLTSSQMSTRLHGLLLIGYASGIDVLDGIRARRRGKSPEGQLVDGYCDRAKEFTQLYMRKSFEGALACFLPSIARAQNEIMNISVPEKDSAGGSMIDRTKLLMMAGFQEVIGNRKKAQELDQELYKRSLATFRNRLHYFQRNVDTPIEQIIEKIKIKELSEFQQQALERFLVYVELLQQAVKKIGKNKTIDDPTINSYLSLNISKLRMKYHFNDYKFSLSK